MSAPLMPRPQVATPTWSVVSQSETIQADATGSFVRGVIVGFKTSNGLSGSVFVPDQLYNKESVYAAIQERVNQMAGIGGLTGEVTP